jgi:hypothetical protein
MIPELHDLADNSSQAPMQAASERLGSYNKYIRNLQTYSDRRISYALLMD